ncbi:hypothetical protein ACEPAG_1327 [Sanghuangporus baumii]
MAELQPTASAVATAQSLPLEPESFIDLGPDSPVLRPRVESKAKKGLRIAVVSTFIPVSACSSPSSDYSSTTSLASSSSASPLSASSASSTSSTSSSSASAPSLPYLMPFSPLSPLSAFSFTLSPVSETGTSYIQSDEDSDLDPDLDLDLDPDPDSDTEFEIDDKDEDDSEDGSDTDVGDAESLILKGYFEDFNEHGDGEKNKNQSEEKGEEEREEKVMPTNIHPHPYRYRLLPALSMPRFTPGPGSMYAPWPYTFKKGDVAFALTREDTHTWQRVTVLDNGLLSSPTPSISRKTETHEPAKLLDSRLLIPPPNSVPKTENYHASPPSPPSPALVYTVQWSESHSPSPHTHTPQTRTRTMLGTFCPTLGNLKPDDKHTRRLLRDEGCTLLE